MRGHRAGGRFSACLTLLLGWTLLVAQPVAATPAADADEARRGLARAVAAGRVQALDAERYRAELTRSLSVLRRLSNARSANLAAVLGDVARQADRYTEARALTLFSMLAVNTSYLARAPMPEQGSDVTDLDGVVYRAFPGQGLQFHPLANFGKVNAAVTAGKNATVHRHVFALLARGVPSGQSLTWEYNFRFAGGSPPWRSGMAQAVAAQALARAGFAREARRAYLAVPAVLLTSLPAGPWIRLYSFSPLAVLNAQLQAAVSLAEYATLAPDGAAAALAGRLQTSAARLLPRFDTGAWSLYALGGSEAPLGYHRYVVSLLELLGRRTGEAAWSEHAARFGLYTRQAPTLTPGAAGPVVFARPADGFRDEARVSFRLSKLATVTLQVAGWRRSVTVTRGLHDIAWNAAGKAPGTYTPRLRAVDPAGNVSEVNAAAITLRSDTEAPELSARLRGTRLTWRAVDEGTPWLRLVLRLERQGGRKVIDLGRNALAGSRAVRVPTGSWAATLIAADSAGNRSSIALGPVAAAR